MNTVETNFLRGWSTIGAYLGMTSDAARMAHNRHRMPILKIERSVSARKAAMDAWLVELERATAAQ